MTQRSEQSIQELLVSVYDADAYGKESRYSEIMDEYGDLQDPGLVGFVGELRREEDDPHPLYAQPEFQSERRSQTR